MSILLGDNLTLHDIQKRKNPDGTMAKITELLSRRKPIFGDVPFMPANDLTSHVYTTRTSLPTGTHRRFNEGIGTEKSTTEQGREPMAMIESYAEVDVALAALDGNPKAYRAKEDYAFMEGMMQTVATTLFYGNHKLENEKIDGLATRYNDLSANQGENIVDAGGTGSDNASIFLVGWGPGSCFGIHPKGHDTGLNNKDLGEQTVNLEGNKKLQAYVTHFKMSYGLVIEDWRNVARLANIDVSDLATAGTSGYSGADLINDLIDLIAKPHGGTDNGANYVLYAPKKVKTALDKIARNELNGNLDYKTVDGKPMTTFQGIPIKEENSLVLTEARVV